MKAKGYSLIEVLVVMTIIGVLFGVGYASYRNFSRRQELIGIKNQVEGDLRKAQQNALSGIKPDGCEKLVGYNFLFITTSPLYGYKIQAVCSNSTTDIETVSLPDGIEITIDPPSSNPILYKVLGQWTNLSGTVKITFTQIATGNTTDISVYKGGPVK